MIKANPWLQILIGWMGDYPVRRAEELRELETAFHHSSAGGDGREDGEQPACGATPGDISRDKGPAEEREKTPAEQREKSFVEKVLERRNQEGDKNHLARGRVLPDEQLEHDKGRDR